MNRPDPAPFLPYARPWLEEEDRAAVMRVLASDYLTTGPEGPRFEAALAEAVNAPHAMACASGTAALHLAARASGLGPGECAIVPTVTFLATANVVIACGAEVVFADVDPQTGLMGPAELDAALARAPRPPRAIFNVHLTGQCATGPVLEAITARARLCGAILIDDGAHALGARYENVGAAYAVGSNAHCDLTAFSFHATKIVAMGEGGAVTARDETLAEKIRRDLCHGMVREPAAFESPEIGLSTEDPQPWVYEMPEPGLNYRASDIATALAGAQLDRLESTLAHRRQLAARYDATLAPLAPIVCPVPRSPGVNSAWHLYSVLIDFAAAGISRGELMKRLKAKGIGTQVHYIPVHLQPYYRRLSATLSLPGAEQYYARTLSLPMWAGLESHDVERVSHALRSSLGV